MTEPTEKERIAALRAEGFGWAVIGTLLGITRQKARAALHRGTYRKKDGSDEPTRANGALISPVDILENNPKAWKAKDNP